MSSDRERRGSERKINRSNIVNDSDGLGNNKSDSFKKESTANPFHYPSLPNDNTNDTNIHLDDIRNYVFPEFRDKQNQRLGDDDASFQLDENETEGQEGDDEGANPSQNAPVPELPSSASNTAIAGISLNYYFADRNALEDAKRFAYQEQLNRLQNSLNFRDPTIPRTRAAVEKCVLQLVAAFRNTKGVMDQDTKKGKAQAVNKMDNLSEDGQKFLEMVAWGVVFNAIDAQFGIRLFEHTDLSQEDYDSFHDRWLYILDAAARSKALVKMQFDALHIQRLAARPQAEKRSRENNQKLNNRRNEETYVGRAARKVGKTADDFVDENKETQKKPSTTPPKKPRIPAKRKTPSQSQASASIKKESTQRRRRPINDNGDDESPSKKMQHVAAPSVMTTLGDLDQVITASPDNVQSSPSGAQSVVTGPPPAIYHPPAFALPGPQRFSPEERRRRFQHVSLADLEIQVTYVYPQPGAREELEERYRRMICQLLRVGYVHADSLSLLELRLYARMYNPSMQEWWWYYRELRNQYQWGQGDYLYVSPRNYVHFTEALPRPHFLALARERQDILADGQVNLQGRHCIPVPNEEDSRALGMVANPVSMPVSLIANPIDDRPLNPTQ